MSLFTDVELLIMASVIGVLLLLVIILSIAEIVSKKKERNKIEENDEYEYYDLENDQSINSFTVKEEIENDKLYDTLTNLNKIQDKPLSIEDMSVYEKTDNFEENNKVQQEDNNLSELLFEEIDEVNPTIQDESLNIIKIESEELLELDSKEKAQIELLKIEEQLEHEKSLEDTITNLEILEEENAIISYQELLNTHELDVVLSDDGDEPITINEVFKLFSETKEDDQVMEMVDALPISEAYHGDFTSTPYLSPINGLETESLSEIQLENTANLEKLEKEIRKTNEFLNILNELKKNLE